METDGKEEENFEDEVVEVGLAERWKEVSWLAQVLAESCQLKKGSY